MSDGEVKFLLFFGGGAILLIFAVRKWKPSKKYLDEVKDDGSPPERFAARYLRDLSWSEIAVYVGAPILWLAIIYLWGWWHKW